MIDQRTTQLPEGYVPDPALLEGRTILVAGASGAIGGATAKASAAHGATVILLGKTVRRLEAVYDLIAAAGGPEPAIYPMNLEGAGPADYDDLAARLGEHFGRLDGLAWCAGLPGVPSPIEHQEVAEWLQVFHVNVHAPFLLLRVLLPLLRAAPDPALVMLASSLAMRGRAYRGAYAVTQAALRGFADVVADELEGGVRVSCLDPGPVRSRLRAASHPAESRDTASNPDSVAPAMLYLLGPDSPHTGAWLRL